MSFSALNYIDYIVLAVLFTSGVLAILRGLTRELMGFAGWGIAAIAARLLQPTMIALLEDYIIQESAVEIIAWMLPFVGIVLAWFVFSNIISPGLKRVAFGRLDRPLGFLFGALRGIVVVALIYTGVLFLTKGEGSFPDAVKESVSIAPVRIVATILTGFAPDDFREQVQGTIPEQNLDDIKEKLSDQADEQLGDIQDKTEDIIDDSEDGNLLPEEENIFLPESN